MEKTENYINPNPEESQSTEARDVNGIDPATGLPNWLSIAQDAYKSSTDYFDANIRKQIEKNISLFRSKHPAGSKYFTDSYKYRSKIFRPKTRSTIRKHEAAAALAFFSTLDTVSCLAEDSKDHDSVEGARYGKNWLEYRLEHSIPWFKTVIGAYQDAMTTGIIISRQEWMFKEEEEIIETVDIGDDGLVNLNEDDEISYKQEIKRNIVVDKPDIILVPVENFRFSIAADWRDPVGTSPFLIEMLPMYVGDVKERMETDNKKTGEKKWFTVPDGEIRSANFTGDYDTTRRVREGKRQDSKDETFMTSLFDVVWVHRNIIRHSGVDWLYYTLGTEKLLSEPVPVTEVYQHGRPYVIGSAVIETHKNYTSGLPELSESLQIEANDIVNQRLDNVKLVLNSRHFAKRGSMVDWKALTRSVPGGVVLMDDLTDVKPIKVQDVTGSSYQEQDRINTDMDEIVGNFSTSSVQTNRSLNETVGGMAMQMDDSNVITEYQLRVFTESWVEEVLRMLITMGQKYETDERVLKLVGEGADPDKVETLMDATYGVKVAVGFGATSPQKRIEKLNIGLKTIKEHLPDMMRRVKGEEVLKEVFGALGYRDGSRFFTPSDEEDPQVKQLNDEIGRLTQIIETEQVKEEGKIQVQQIKEDGATQRKQMELDMQKVITDLDGQLKYIGHQLNAEKNDIVRGELILQQEALTFKMRESEIAMLSDENEKMSSILMDENYTKVGKSENDKSTVVMNDRYANVPEAEG